MTKFEFRDKSDVLDTLSTSLEDKLIIPNDASDDPDELRYYCNGDELRVNCRTGVGFFDTLDPENAHTSKISLRFHQWYTKGIIHSLTQA